MISLHLLQMCFICLKENNVKDLNATYSNDTGTFADGDKIKINGSFGKIISKGIEVTTELLKDGKIKEQVYLSSSKAAIHAPGGKKLFNQLKLNRVIKICDKIDQLKR